MYRLMFILICLSIVECKQKPLKVVNILNSDTSNFFPVSNFIESDIIDVIKTPYYIYKLKENSLGNKDSSALTREEFKKLANEFLLKNITTPIIKPHYRETVFHDLSTKSITITYSTLDHDLEVQNVLILLNDSTKKLNRIFILCYSNQQDSSITSQYNWKVGRSFQINRSIKRKNGFEYEEHNTIVWNEKVIK